MSLDAPRYPYGEDEGHDKGRDKDRYQKRLLSKEMEHRENNREDGQFREYAAHYHATPMYRRESHIKRSL